MALALAELPSVKHRVNMLVDDLANRRSVVMLLPRGVETGWLATAIRASLWARSMTWEALDSVTAGSPSVEIGRFLGNDRLTQGLPLVAVPADERARWPDVLFLPHLDALGDADQKAWAHFFLEWAESSQSLHDAGEHTLVLCLLSRASSVLCDLPDSRRSLIVSWWWGVPSLLEMRLLYRLEFGRASGGLAERWAEHALAAVAANDVGLAEFIWDAPTAGLDILESKLLEYAEHVGMEKAGIAAALVAGPFHYSGYSAPRPPAKLQHLWMKGAVVFTTEFGMELSAPALACLGKRDELSHRIWRGQAELLLPLIDMARLRLCTHMARRYGTDWPLRWDEPESIEERMALKESHLACQWGYLERLIRNVHELSKEQRLLGLVTVGRGLRNELAHYRPASSLMVQSFLQRMSDV